VSGTFVLLDLAGYVGLLLWGTYMVTSGVERGFGSELRHWLGRNLRGRVPAFLAGLGITALLQSSTATALMATSFTAAGLIALGPALAIMLGANVGTTLVTQILSFNIEPLAPPLVLAGVIAFRLTNDDRWKNVGRAAIGLGLILLALAGLTRALTPIEAAPALKTILDALKDQTLLLVVIGALLTWACHSSVAIVLLVVSLATHRIIAPTPALALVLGANLGATLPSLLEAGSPIARRLPLGNAVARLIGCSVVLPLLPLCATWLGQLDARPARLVVNFHTIFNLLLAVCFIGSTERVARLLTRLLPDPPKPADPGEPIYLEPTALDSATIALTNAARETLRMADMVQEMLRDTMSALRSGDRRTIGAVSRMGRALARLAGAIRSYLADLGNMQPLDDEQEGARAQEILSAVINLEHVGSIIVSNLLEVAARAEKERCFSAEESQEITAIYAELVESLRLAVTVFLSGDPKEAARLVGRKSAFREMETRATALHVRLLRDAAAVARASDGDRVGAVAQSSGSFLSVVGDLRRVHSLIATFGYAVLNRAHHQSASSPLDQHDAAA
jgi:phosphate:Na+ symporter